MEGIENLAVLLPRGLSNLFLVIDMDAQCREPGIFDGGLVGKKIGVLPVVDEGMNKLRDPISLGVELGDLKA